jgi:hypothetical protein
MKNGLLFWENMGVAGRRQTTESEYAEFHSTNENAYTTQVTLQRGAVVLPTSQTSRTNLVTMRVGSERGYRQTFTSKL